MELNQFRNVDVVLDKANDNFIQKQFVSAGDKDGRSLTVQITENGAVGEVIGLTLNLRWHNEASGLTDLSAFSVVDKATSVFKIDYPQNLLTPGKVVAYIQILHGGKVTHTKPFEITVQNLAGTTRGVLATAEYGALVTTLAKANEFETDIAKKVGGGVLATMGDMGQDVKTAMTGGSVAVVGEGAVAKVNLANDLKNKVEEIDKKENLTTSTRNIFNPDDVIHGQAHLNNGTLIYNSNYKRSPKYASMTGETWTISGIENMGAPGTPFPDILMWNGDVAHSIISFPSFKTTDYITFTMPEGTTHFSFNINQGSIPKKLQVEKGERTPYQPYKVLEHGVTSAEVEELIYKRSTKNLYDGRVATNYRTLSIGMQDTQSEGDTVSSFTPVEYGKYYTISGLNPLPVAQRVHGYSNGNTPNGGFIKTLPSLYSETVEIYIDDERIKFIIFDISLASHGGTKEKAENLKIQVEEGRKATSYEPMWSIGESYEAANIALENVAERIEQSHPEILTDFKELDTVRGNTSDVGNLTKGLAPLGISYTLSGESNKDSMGNNLYTQHNIVTSGTKEIYINLANFINDKVSVGKLKPMPFTVPSGQLDNEGTLNNWNQQFNNDDLVHPDIAYSATGVAGYKYWMISSIYPSINDGKALWEDEDLFVSNNGKDWLRVKSLYEGAKSYTAPNISLPPQSLVTDSARKHAFLPVPSVGDTIETSVPADNGAPALDRVSITVQASPWKHDPAILIDNGYVYTYHSFHLPYTDRTGGSNRFLVCIRTNDGINWEVVRTDGSTMPLTEETSRQIFTKDNQGRYNYMYYAYSRNYSNLKVVKYGEGDYELLYGYNFTFRVKGTTPYNFDFSQQYPLKDLGGGNHPAALLDKGNLYIMTNNLLAVSSDRGESFTTYQKYPAWQGGISGYPYKKALCIGEGGKVILADVERQNTNEKSKPNVNGFSATIGVHQMYLYEYPSVADLVSKAQNGLVDGYIDLQLVKVNYKRSSRSTRLYPYITNNATTSIVNNPLQRIKVTDIEVEGGDVLHLYVSLNARNGARIVFGGIEIV